jgi:hypothetical protein
MQAVGSGVLWKALGLSLLVALGVPGGGGAQTNEECFMCHADADLSKEGPGGKKVSLFVDEQAYGGSVHAKIQCVLCHTDIQAVPHQEGSLKPVQCHRCHTEVATQFVDSIHFRSIRRGDVFAPGCRDCHGTHNVLSHNDPRSRTAKGNVLNVCGTCHEGVGREYAGSYHGQLVAQGNAKAPTCYDCHQSHQIGVAAGKVHRLHVVNLCGGCHEKHFHTFRDTFHGKMTALGEVTGAKCYDCHGSHSIFPTQDIRSAVHRQNLLGTCRKCHGDAPENYVTYIPHADIHDPSNPVLYYTNLFMVGILAVTFAFFGLHSLLWLNRLLVAWAARRLGRRPDDGGHS